MLLVHWLLGTSRCLDPVLRRILAHALIALGGIHLWRVWHVYCRHNKSSNFMANYAMHQPLTFPPTSSSYFVGVPALTTACGGVWRVVGAAKDEKENSVKKLYKEWLSRSHPGPTYAKHRPPPGLPSLQVTPSYYRQRTAHPSLVAACCNYFLFTQPTLCGERGLTLSTMGGTAPLSPF